ncbi:MAG: hypothetical protein Ct9H300mP14_01200 [Gammaproteobacteria bacterium]|nr:MAG: hypothetical protein Ct9H300mP14_01200 [Gammaproteobacteria bacterium]
MKLKTPQNPFEGIGDVQLELVWDPPWDMDRLGEAARLERGPVLNGYERLVKRCIH